MKQQDLPYLTLLNYRPGESFC